MSETCANPLLLQWTKEIWEQVRERNEKKGVVYKRAYESLKACPLKFDHPSEAQQLNGIGPKICEVLTDKLEKHCHANGIPMPQPKMKGSKRKANETAPGGPQPAKKPRKPKVYVPALRSGPYAMIIALATLSEDATQGLTKDDIIHLAQPSCDSSFTVPSEPKSFFTAWNSMKSLLQKGLVYEHGRPTKRYMLTEDGWEVANTMEMAAKKASSTIDGFMPSKSNDRSIDSQIGPSILRKPTEPSVQQIRGGPGHQNNATDFIDVMLLMSSPEKEAPSRVPAPIPLSESRPQFVQEPSLEVSTHIPAFTPFILQPGSFSVHLVLDNREVRTMEDRDYISKELSKKGVTPLTRSLELGDALWVAKCHNPEQLRLHHEEGDEIVLDHIVERKRLDDLVGSIKDGRFHEQKFRLRKSGIQNVVYLVEEISMTQEATSKYAEAVASAIATTQVVNGYFVKKTPKLDDTIRYLTRMTMMLKELYEPKPLHVIPSRVLTAKNHLPLLSHLRQTEPLKTYHLTFSAFSSLTSKSDILSLRDVFLKMLMCTRGVTGDKALEIQRRWKTPRALIEALESLGDSEKCKETLISDSLGELVGRKKIGRVLSGKIAEVWG